MPKAVLVGDVKPSELEFFNQELTIYYTIGIVGIWIRSNEVTFQLFLTCFGVCNDVICCPFTTFPPWQWRRTRPGKGNFRPG